MLFLLTYISRWIVCRQFESLYLAYNSMMRRMGVVSVVVAARRLWFWGWCWFVVSDDGNRLRR